MGEVLFICILEVYFYLKFTFYNLFAMKHNLTIPDNYFAILCLKFSQTEKFISK